MTLPVKCRLCPFVVQRTFQVSPSFQNEVAGVITLAKRGFARNDKVKVTRRDQVKVTHPGLKSFSLVHNQ